VPDAVDSSVNCDGARNRNDYGVAYKDLVNAARRQIPDNVRFICAKATAFRWRVRRMGWMGLNIAQGHPQRRKCDLAGFAISPRRGKKWGIRAMIGCTPGGEVNGTWLRAERGAGRLGWSARCAPAGRLLRSVTSNPVATLGPKHLIAITSHGPVAPELKYLDASNLRETRRQDQLRRTIRWLASVQKASHC
jgi:hypothetical protein